MANEKSSKRRLSIWSALQYCILIYVEERKYSRSHLSIVGKIKLWCRSYESGNIKKK
jgi:hypothetical protein